MSYDNASVDRTPYDLGTSVPIAYQVEFRDGLRWNISEMGSKSGADAVEILHHQCHEAKLRGSPS